MFEADQFKTTDNAATPRVPDPYHQFPNKQSMTSRFDSYKNVEYPRNLNKDTKRMTNRRIDNNDNIEGHMEGSARDHPHATITRVKARCLIDAMALRLDRTEGELKSALLVGLFPNLEVMHSILNF